MPFLELIITVLRLYVWVVIIGIILHWLLTFGAVNGRNELVQAINRFCSSATEPALRRIRRYVKPINGFDLSPIVLILGIYFIISCLRWYVAPLLLSARL